MLLRLPGVARGVGESLWQQRRHGPCVIVGDRWTFLLAGLTGAVSGNGSEREEVIPARRFCMNQCFVSSLEIHNGQATCVFHLFLFFSYCALSHSACLILGLDTSEGELESICAA